MLAIVIPVQDVSHNPLLSALFGGILTGIGVAYPLKYGFSTGGMDIIAVILEKTTGKTIGTLMMATNLVIILIAGAFFWLGKCLIHDYFNLRNVASSGCHSHSAPKVNGLYRDHEGRFGNC